jgi:hypothetical protein
MQMALVSVVLMVPKGLGMMELQEQGIDNYTCPEDDLP